MTNTEQELAKANDNAKRILADSFEPFFNWIKTRMDRFPVEGIKSIEVDGTPVPVINTPLAIRTFIAECHGEHWASETLAAALAHLSIVLANDQHFQSPF